MHTHRARLHVYTSADVTWYTVTWFHNWLATYSLITMLHGIQSPGRGQCPQTRPSPAERPPSGSGEAHHTPISLSPSSCVCMCVYVSVCVCQYVHIVQYIRASVCTCTMRCLHTLSTTRALYLMKQKRCLSFSCCTTAMGPHQDLELWTASTTFVQLRADTQLT